MAPWHHASARRPSFTAVIPASIAITLILLTRSALSGQGRALTPHGHPDLQGIWLNNTATPLERPKEVGGRPSFTEEEARAYEQRYQLDRTAALARGDQKFELEVAGDLDTYEPGPLLPGRRTSLITDPADGRVPALTPDGQRRLSARTEHLKVHYSENPEDFPNAERCLVVGTAAVPPLMPAFYNNNLQIVQTRDAVMIVSEMIHEARIISLTRREHLPSVIRRWTGDSIGRWEGDTLVVDTTNFTEKTTIRGSGTGLRVVERFSLSDATTLRYQFTVEDPASFVRSWSADTLMPHSDGPMFEYACHEANYSLTNVLRGSRFQEQAGSKN